MTTEEKVYLFKLKADKLDSKSFANIKIPVIIYLLNEGMMSLLKKRYTGLNTNSRAAFDETQKRKDEFQRLVVPDEVLKVSKVNDETFIADLNKTKRKYMLLLRCNFLASKENCSNRRIGGSLKQIDDLDLVLNSTMDGPSFEWGETPYILAEDKVRVFTDKSFVINKAVITYLRYPVLMDMEGYRKFDGSYSKNVNCELPEFIHDDIVEEALFIYSESFNNPNMQAKILAMQNKE